MSDDNDREYQEYLMKGVRKFEAEATTRMRLKAELEATGREPMLCPVCHNRPSVLGPSFPRCIGVLDTSKREYVVPPSTALGLLGAEDQTAIPAALAIEAALSDVSRR